LERQTDPEERYKLEAKSKWVSGLEFGGSTGGPSQAR